MQTPHTAIELTVRNHPGALSHIAGLLARRAYNLGAATCAPLPGGECSRMILLVEETERIEQVCRQLEKLHDVLALRLRPDLRPEQFAPLAAW